jgi:hypothetical protein
MKLSKIKASTAVADILTALLNGKFCIRHMGLVESRIIFRRKQKTKGEEQELRETLGKVYH